jgi:Domain of unknown function (DUF4129)
VRSRPELRAFALVLLLATSFAALADNQPVTRAEVDHAVEVVKKDPNLSSEKTVRTLHWDDSKEKKKEKDREPTNWPEWLHWVGDMFAWIGEASRMLMWLVIGSLAALLAYFAFKIFAAQRFTAGGKSFVPPTHVQDLDIRPESLPADIGATARALWDRGEQRAALALLYRGLLSRLVHVYEVPIRDSSTEGDCLALASRKLEASRVDYATRLVRTWQRAIYGGLSIDSAVVHELCAQFDLHLEQPRADEATPRAGFAGRAAA